MDLLEALESMATNITPLQEDTISEADTARWQQLFDFTPEEAARRIEDYRNDYSRPRISDELWATVRARKEAEGYDQEAYEYSLFKYQQPREAHRS